MTLQHDDSPGHASFTVQLIGRSTDGADTAAKWAFGRMDSTSDAPGNRTGADRLARRVKKGCLPRSANDTGPQAGCDGLAPALLFHAVFVIVIAPWLHSVWTSSTSFWERNGAGVRTADRHAVGPSASGAGTGRADPRPGPVGSRVGTRGGRPGRSAHRCPGPPATAGHQVTTSRRAGARRRAR